MAHDEATLSQNRASDPFASTWLSANAGSGKTKVLTDRVARLLLRGVLPQNILCLTYTKAAASEMQNRLFGLLGDWAMKEDTELEGELQKLDEDPAQDLNAARRLFARAIETPGGLKIQTIHSFCAALLRRFPLEAGISPQFREMDERSELILREEVLEALALGADKAALATLAAFYSGQDFGALMKDISAKRQHFAKDVGRDEIWQWFSLPPNYDNSAVLDSVFLSTDAKLLSDFVPVLRQGIATDQKSADILAPFGQAPTLEQLVALEGLFLYGKGAKSGPFSAKINAFPGKALRLGAAASFMPAIEALMLRVESARERRISLYSAQKTHALHQFARPFLQQYEAQKLQRGWLDFEDLIQKASALLSDPLQAAWVLFRLDGGIDHILVDEAQDTSPAQWTIIEHLAREFTSGKGSRENVRRTIFVVGDPKQSIYSFQGAAPAAFSRMNSHFSTGLTQIGDRLENRKLEHSFRSAPAILQLADHALLDRPGLGEPFRHIAYFGDKPGRVDLWPALEKEVYSEGRSWSDTADIELPQSHVAKLGNAVADEVARLLKEESIQAKGGAFMAVEPGDILILVRRRTGGLFNEIIRACKAQDLPIAGADRMRIGAELAVKDMTALLRFLATPEDDLSLAAALRSPLFGLSEEKLYGLAQPRAKGVYLWAAMRANPEAYNNSFQVLSSLRNKADFLRPYELLERILTRHHGRQNLLARLGREAEDGIDALLSQALAYESTQTPSLTGFLEWLDAMEVTIKRQTDNAGNQIRVMTVHGAKGLEAPIVFLPDTAKTRPRPAPELLPISSGALAWRPPSENMPGLLKEAGAAIAEAEEQETARLLYVAATRAKNWLIIAAAGDVGSDRESWHTILENGMTGVGAVPFNSPMGPGLRHETGKWAPPREDQQVKMPEAADSLPDWARNPAPAAPALDVVLTPSDLGGAKALAAEHDGLSGDDARRRGRQLHRLLEFLPDYPRPQWPELAQNLLAHGEDSAPPEEAGALCKAVTSLLTKPELSYLFAPGSLAEVEISASLPALHDQRIHGIIDRLVITADRVLVVDFKSNATVPTRAGEVPEGILRQMGAYLLAVRQIFPNHRVECAILWTVNAELMPIPSDQVTGTLSPP